MHKKYLYIYARANCASRSLNFVNKNKNTCVSDNNPFTGKRMGKHINFKRQYQTAFITYTLKIFGQKLARGITRVPAARGGF